MTAKNNGLRVPEAGTEEIQGHSGRTSQGATSVPKLIISDQSQTRRLSSLSGFSTSSSQSFSTLSSSAPNTPLSPRTEYTSDGTENLDDGVDAWESEFQAASTDVNPDGTGRPSTKFQDILLSSLIECDNQRTDKGFFPNGTVTALITRESVGQELRRWREFRRLGSVHLDRLTRYICENSTFKKIFALLALVDELIHIEKFISDDVTDYDLPLCKVFLPGSHLFGLGRNGNPRHALGCFASWTHSSIRSFEEWQWTMLAPTFEKSQHRDVQHVVLSHRHPLPFIRDSRLDPDDTLSHGGHGTVFKVEIHPDHHNFNKTVGGTNTRTSFAVKRLSSRDKARFKQEVDMLITFSCDSYKHLISLLATYQQGNEYYLIFPWAGGDLRSYWRDINPEPTMNHDTIKWLSNQCYGIAKGLFKIHEHKTSYFRNSSGHPFIPKEFISTRTRSGSMTLFGRHGDIKPQNILWFDGLKNETGKPVLKITDLGLAEFKTSIDQIYKSPDKISMTAAYRPPEYDTENGKVGQSQDIWALGCLYLEMIAWVLGGWKLVQEFERLRVAESTGPRFQFATEGTFFKVRSINENGVWEVVLKPTVTKFINRLHGLPACTNYLHQFLDLIKEEMLVIKSTDAAETGRIRAATLAIRLGGMRKMCTHT